MAVPMLSDGEPIVNSKSDAGAQVPAPAAPPAPKKRGRKRGTTDVVLAKQIVDDLKTPIVYFANEFYAYSQSFGWIPFTRELMIAGMEITGRSVKQTLRPCWEEYLAVPDAKGWPEHPLYLKQIGPVWGGQWEPLLLSQHEVLYSDGIYDVTTKEFRSTGDQVIWGPRITVQCPYAPEFDGCEDPVCEEFEQVIEEALPDPEIRRHFQEVCGQVLQPHSSFRGQIILWGGAGTRKSTVAMAIALAPGGNIGASQMLERDLIKSKWSTHALLNKFANLSDDSPRVSGWPGFIKSYTSGAMTIEAKYAQPYVRPATAKLLSTCNELPDAGDVSSAMVDRMFPFHFDRRFNGTWDHQMTTIAYWCDQFRREGVAAWLLEGLTRLRMRGSFQPPETWINLKQVAMDLADPVEGWLRENLLKTGDRKFVKKDDLRSKMDGGMLRDLTDKKLAGYMSRLFDSKIEQLRDKGSEAKFRAFVGVDWNPGIGSPS